MGATKSQPDLSFRSHLREALRWQNWVGWGALFAGLAAIGQVLVGNGRDELFFAPLTVLAPAGLWLLVSTRSTMDHVFTIAAACGVQAGTSSTAWEELGVSRHGPLLGMLTILLVLTARRWVLRTWDGSADETSRGAAA